MRLIKQDEDRYVVVRDYDDASIGAVTQGTLTMVSNEATHRDDLLAHLTKIGDPKRYELVKDGSSYLIVLRDDDDELAQIVASFYPHLSTSKWFFEEYLLKGRA